MAWAGGVGFVLSSKNDGITCRLREASYNYVRVHITCRVQVEHKSAGYLAYFVATRYFHIIGFYTQLKYAVSYLSINLHNEQPVLVIIALQLEEST